MPKHEIHHNAGEPASNELKQLLQHYFNEKEVDRIERLGGRILISLSSPYHPRKKKNTSKIKVDKRFVSKLQECCDKPLELKSQINQLSVKQIRELGKLIEHPLRTKSSRHELLDELVAHFRGEEVWRKISNIG